MCSILTWFVDHSRVQLLRRRWSWCVSYGIPFSALGCAIKYVYLSLPSLVVQYLRQWGLWRVRRILWLRSQLTRHKINRAEAHKKNQLIETNSAFSFWTKNREILRRVLFLVIMASGSSYYPHSHLKKEGRHNPSFTAVLSSQTSSRKEILQNENLRGGGILSV